MSLNDRIVRSYLLHYGYEDTLNSFDAVSGNSIQSGAVAEESLIDKSAAYALNRRKILRQVVRNESS